MERCKGKNMMLWHNRVIFYIEDGLIFSMPLCRRKYGMGFWRVKLKFIIMKLDFLEDKHHKFAVLSYMMVMTTFISHVTMLTIIS